MQINHSSLRENNKLTISICPGYLEASAHFSRLLKLSFFGGAESCTRVLSRPPEGWGARPDPSSALQKPKKVF